MKRTLQIAAVAACILTATGPLFAQTPWIHVQVDESGEDDTHVNVNLPLSVVQVALEVAPEKFISKGQLHLSHVDQDIEIEDLRRLWNELRDAGDAEFVSVEGDDETVKVRREGDLIRIEVQDHKDDGAEQVRVDVPVAVVDALFAGDGESLNIEGALRELRTRRGDIVRVDDGETKVRVWIDERN